VNEPVESAEKRIRDPASGHFLPGHPAPGPGRPRTTSEMRELFRDLTPDALNRLRELMQSRNEDVALKSLVQALNRGWGNTPITSASGEDEDGEGSGKPRVTVSIDLGG
jgi:hypothetical protein